MIAATARAKINLALHVRRRRADGYHDIETLFAFTEAGDGLSMEPADRPGLTIVGPFAAGLSCRADNLVLRAAALLGERLARAPNVHFTLDKRLPVAAGIGGGSADAAAALRLLCEHWGVDLDDPGVIAIAADLGADVPACLAGGVRFGDGVGDRLAAVSLPGLAGTPVLLANPGVPCPTGPVFAGWNGVDRGPLDPQRWQDARNDLTDPAMRLAPEIGALLKVLRDAPGARHARMSGSGATCFALFEDAAACAAAAAVVRSAVPAAWTAVTRIAP